MPHIQVTMREGRDESKIRALVTALTDAVVESVGAPKDTVTVVVNEVPASRFARGDVTLEEKLSAPER